MGYSHGLIMEGRSTFHTHTPVISIDTGKLNHNLKFVRKLSLESYLKNIKFGWIKFQLDVINRVSHNFFIVIIMQRQY